MIRYLLILCCLLVESGYAIRPGTVTASSAGTGNLVWNWSPGTSEASGVVIFVVQNDGAADEVTTVKVGTMTLTEIAGSPLLRSTGEDGGIHAFFYSGNINQGTYPCSVTVSGSSTKIGRAVGMAGNSLRAKMIDTDVSISSDAVANPTATLSLGGVSSFAFLAFHSGQDAVTGITPSSGWGSLGETDFGTQTCGLYLYSTIGTTDVTMGWTQTSNDALAFGIAVSDSIVLLDTIAVRDTASIVDNFRDLANSGTNYGADTFGYIIATYTDGPTVLKTYTAAWVGNEIPAYREIVACTLNIYQWFADGETVDFETTYPTLSAKRIFKPYYELYQTFDDWHAPDSEFTIYSSDAGSDNNTDGGESYSFTTTATGSYTIPSAANGWVKLDVTDLAREWYAGTVGRRGVHVSTASITGATVDSVLIWTSEYLTDTLLRPNFTFVTDSIPQAAVASGVSNFIHGLPSIGVRHSPAGNSVLHKK